MLSIWSFLLASCSGLRLASGDMREQFNPPKATVGTVEVRVLFTGNSRYIALSNRKLSAAEHHDAQISRPVMVNIRWSQSEESQLVESLPAGNSIELIATNLSRSTNSVFSRLHHPGVISINRAKAIDINYRDVGFKEKT